VNDLFYYIRKYRTIPQQVCEESVKFLKNQKWQSHGWYDHETKQNINKPEDLKVLFGSELISIIDPHVNLAVQLYHQEFGELIYQRSPIRFNKYEVGQKMDNHYDHIRDVFDGERKGIPVLTTLGIFNEDYEGGELIIADKHIRTRGGDVLVWPSCFLYPHEIKKVTKGTRYSFVSWGY
jgi:predicted 2-oxoglutarate/Fe(II)-dependent dioxygenase YbiX